MPKVRANGIDIHYEVRGKEANEPLLLIAGFACDLSIWSKVASPLAAKYRVILFDNRGVGRTTAPDSPYSMRQMADDAGALLEAIGVGSAHVAGHSMGGQIAQELVLAHPEKVRSLMLLASCARPDERNKAIITSWGELPRQVEPAAAARLSLPWIYTSRFFGRPNAIQQIVDLIVANPFPAPAHGIYHQSRAIVNFDALDLLGQIHCPTLVLVGQEDALLPIRYSDELVRAIPGAELVILEKTGHGFVIESADAVASALIHFLADR